MKGVGKNGVVTVRKMTESELAKEAERLRSRARHNEASALNHARLEGQREEREKWQETVADKDAMHAKAIADKDATHAKAIAEKDAMHAKTIAEMQALIAELQAQRSEDN